MSEGHLDSTNFFNSKPFRGMDLKLCKAEPTRKRKKLSRNGDSQAVTAICKICRQNVLDPKTKLFQGLPGGALEEEAALTDDRLQLYCDGRFIPEIDIKPLHKITCFTVFDGEGHLCPFDTGLIENDELIFFSGYIKPIYDDDPSPRNGVPAQELGPIVEWWISGYDGGNSFLIAFQSPYAEYILMESSPEYSSFMRVPKLKALLAKIVIEFLSNSNKPTFDELLSRISELSVPDDTEPLNERSLQNHAQFIIDQVRDIDYNNKLMSTPAIQYMIEEYKVNVRKTCNEAKKSKRINIFNIVATDLVRSHFKFIFEDNNNTERARKIVPPESLPSIKFNQFFWEENSNFASVNGENVSVKDFVMISTNVTNEEQRIFRIEKFFQQNFTKQVHCTEYVRGEDTVLGSAGNPLEIFYVERCSDWPICKILKKIKVNVKIRRETWSHFSSCPTEEIKETEFFVQKKYSLKHGSFENFEENRGFGCAVCAGNRDKDDGNISSGAGKLNEALNVIFYDSIIWNDEEYLPGCCVYVDPFAVVFDSQKSCRRIEKSLVTIKVDESIYPEVYRKSKEVSLLEDCPEPFVIGRVKNIFSRVEVSKRKFFFTINKFYRPKNTRIIEAEDHRMLDLRLLYWSKEEAQVSIDHVRGRCDVMYSNCVPSLELSNGFYFNAGFDASSESFYEAGDVVIKRRERDLTVVKKLKTLNPFSGCGGLAEGLRQSGIADIAWAVEIDKRTAESFKLNFPQALMFEKDCNSFLRDVLSGKSVDENGNRYPVRGEVEFLCGGPPCQGFSTMNRFTSKEESRYNNSLILTYLSFCDYYRPKFFLMENVKNFVSYKKSIFLRHVLGCLNAMGYQCCFGVLQAGNYGLPQARRRLFIVAAAPSFRLPFFPKPTNVFFGSTKNTECEVGGVSFVCRYSKETSGSAPYRNVTIRDAISDLPPICLNPPGSRKSRVPKNPTFYQNFLMGFSSNVEDHATKEISPLNEARIRHIPAAKGCDWRDLPNIKVSLRDGAITDLLKYSYHDYKNGKSSCGFLRGVCPCASGKPCNSKERQVNTLIPWFLVHTANRNNNWAGLYGRLDWQGVFNTVTTNPEPSNQQGKVLHPDEDRIISVRECARAQGLPDSFRLKGTLAEKYKQVGNAVPPPMARAIGLEIRKSLMP